MYIYIILNLITNKCYIGQTTKTIKDRWKGHLNTAKNGKNKKYIHNTLNKYGHENFIIEQVDSAKTLDELNEKEAFWAIFYNSYAPNGYNLTKCGNYHATHESIINKYFAKNYSFISPSGEIFKIRNLKRFCKKNNLDRCHMYKLAQGKRSNHKGWKNANQKLGNVIIEDSNKKIHKIEIFKGSISKFCEENNLKYPAFYALIYKSVRTNKTGWRVLERNFN